MSLYVNIKKRLGAFGLHVEFSLENGVAGVIGASGCGKSLTLRSIAGIVRPDEGKIVLNGDTLFDSGRGINLQPQKRRVGYLFQNYALFPSMTVEQNIACGLCHEKNKAARKRAADEMMERMRLGGLERRYPHELSGGQQQRTALARILVGKPEALLLDEPFSALDSHLRDQLLVEIRDILKAFGKDTLLVTHSRDEAYKLCGMLAVMDSGRLSCMKGKAEMFADPGTRTGAALTGCKNIIEARKAGGTLVEVPAWGVAFDIGRPVGDGLCAIGVRAHYFGADIAANSFPVRVVEQIEEPFEWTVKFMYEGQRKDSDPIWWRFSKSAAKMEMPGQLGVEPGNILLLYA